MYDLRGYDYAHPGLVHLSIEESGIDINEYTSFSLDDYERFAAESIEMDCSNNFIIYNGREGIIAVDGIRFIETIVPNRYYQKLYLNNNCELFLYRDDILRSAEFYYLELIKFSQNILGIQKYAENSVVLLKDSLLVYNADFSIEETNIAFQHNVLTLNALHFTDSLIYAVHNLGETYKIMSYDWSGNSTVLHEGNRNNEYFKGIDALTDSTFLLTGTKHYKDFVAIDFFRNVNISSLSDYKRVNVEISNYKIEVLKIDSVISSINNSDTIWNYLPSIDLNFDLVYEGSDSILNTQVMNSSKVFSYSSAFPSMFRIDSLKVNEKTSYSFEIGFVLETISELELCIPGGNYSFNESQLSCMFPDLISDAEEIVQEFEFNIFPNPTYDVLNLDSHFQINNINIYNNQGVLLKAHYSANGLRTIDISELDQGVLFLHCINGAGRISMKKVVKM